MGGRCWTDWFGCWLGPGWSAHREREAAGSWADGFQEGEPGAAYRNGDGGAGVVAGEVAGVGVGVQAAVGLIEHQVDHAAAARGAVREVEVAGAERDLVALGGVEGVIGVLALDVDRGGRRDG